MLHYLRPNNDVIIDVKTFWRPFLLFSWHKKRNCTQKLLVFQGNLYLYRTRIIVNGCYWNTCRLVFTITRSWLPGLIQGYCSGSPTTVQT